MTQTTKKKIQSLYVFNDKYVLYVHLFLLIFCKHIKLKQYSFQMTYGDNEQYSKSNIQPQNKIRANTDR